MSILLLDDGGRLGVATFTWRAFEASSTTSRSSRQVDLGGDQHREPEGVGTVQTFHVHCGDDGVGARGPAAGERLRPGPTRWWHASAGAPDLDLAAHGPAGAVLQMDGEVVLLGFDGDPDGRVHPPVRVRR